MTAVTPRRVWVALFAGALLLFAGCGVGALDCAVFRPIGLALVLGAAAVSLLDRGSDTPAEAEARVLPGPGRRG